MAAYHSLSTRTEGPRVVRISSPTSLHLILLGGDQLTAAQARGAKKTRVNSVTCGTRLDGLIPCAEYWHTKMNLLDVSYF